MMNTTTNLETLIDDLFTKDYLSDERKNVSQTIQGEYKVNDERITKAGLAVFANEFSGDKKNITILKNVCELIEPLYPLKGLPWDDSANLIDLLASATTANGDNSQTTMENDTMYNLNVLVGLIIGGVIGYNIGRIVERQCQSEKTKEINTGKKSGEKLHSSSSSTDDGQAKKWELQLLIHASRSSTPLIEGETTRFRLQQLITDSRAFRCQETGASVPTDDSKTIEWGQATNVLLSFTLDAAPVKTEIKTHGFLPGTKYNYEYPNSAKSATNLIRLLAKAHSIHLTTIALCPKSPKSLAAEFGFIAI